MQPLSGFVLGGSKMINVNLLPPESKKEITQAKKNRTIRGVFLKTLLLLLLTLLISITAWYYFSQNLSRTSSELKNKEEQMTKYGTLEEKAKKVSERLDTIKQIEQNTNHWSSVIAEIQKVIPNGIYLNSVKIEEDPKTRSQISGFAQSKQEVATLRDAMDKSDKFRYVDIEVSTTAKDPLKKRDIESFTISFSLEKGALK